MSDNSESEFIEYGSECYEVQAIRDRKFVKGKPHYFIKWKGWAEQDNTWEPIQNLQTVINIVKDFQASLDAKNNANSTKKDKKLAVQPKTTPTPSNYDLPKKTKIIEKEKKPKKGREERLEKSQGEVSSSRSESGSSRSSSMSKVNKKKAEKKESMKELNKKSSVSENVQKSRLSEKQRLRQKQKESDKKRLGKESAGKQSKGKDKERSREKQKEKTAETSLTKKFNSMSVIQKQPQAPKPTASTTTKPFGVLPSADMIQITRINYHIMREPQLPSQTPRLFYNVDRRNRVTRKLLPVAEIPSEEMINKSPGMIVEYLENFVKEVELCVMEEKEYERRRNGGQQGVGQGEVKLGVIGKMRK